MKEHKHDSHETRISMDASSYDEICVHCGATDNLGGWGNLAKPCTNVPKYATEEAICTALDEGENCLDIFKESTMSDKRNLKRIMRQWNTRRDTC